MVWRVDYLFFVNYSFLSFWFSFVFAFDPGDAGSYIDAFEFPLTALSLSFNVISLTFSHLSRTIGDDHDLQVSAIVLYPH